MEVGDCFLLSFSDGMRWDCVVVSCCCRVPCFGSFRRPIMPRISQLVSLAYINIFMRLVLSVLSWIKSVKFGIILICKVTCVMLSLSVLGNRKLVRISLRFVLKRLLSYLPIGLLCWLMNKLSTGRKTRRTRMLYPVIPVITVTRLIKLQGAISVLQNGILPLGNLQLVPSIELIFQSCIRILIVSRKILFKDSPISRKDGFVTTGMSRVLITSTIPTKRRRSPNGRSLLLKKKRKR